MNLIKEEILMDKNTANETVQIMMEGEMIVPDSKGDLEEIVSSNARCYINDYDVTGNRLNFKGVAEISVIYLTKDKRPEGMSASYDIMDFISVDSLTLESVAQLEICVISLECRAVNERKVAYKMLAEVTSHIYDTYTGNVVTEIEEPTPENFCFKKLECTNILDKSASGFTVKEQMKIQRDQPNINDIIELNVQPVNINAHCIDEGLNISGDLKVTMIYNGEEGSNPMEVFTGEIPVNGSLEVDGAEENMMCCPKIWIKRVFYNILADEDGENRIIEVECELGVYTNVISTDEKTVLDDAYCLDKMLDLEQHCINSFKTICCNKSQCPIKQPVEIDGPDMLRIYNASGKAMIDSVTVEKDKTIVDGVLEVKVLYVTVDDSKPVFCYNGDLPFSQTLETRGSDEGMTAFVTAVPQHIGFNMMSQREVEIRGMLAIDCVVIENNVNCVVTDIEEKPLPEGYLDKLPSVVVYVVKKGDTLWKLAKRFNTTVDDIVELNDIENPDLIYPGERLIILKRIA